MDLSLEDYHRIVRVKLFNLGHSMSEIDALSLEDLGDILAYEAEKGKAEKTLQERRQRLRSGGKGS